MTTEPFKRDFFRDYDLNDPELNERWDELITHMHQGGCPVARSEVGEGYWILNKHEDIIRAGEDWETFSASDGFMVNRPEGQPYFKPGECDPPVHTALRATLEPFFRPRAIRILEPRVREHANRLIDGCISEGRCDVVEYANTLAQAVFSVEIAGMDIADMPFLKEAFELAGPPEQRVENFGKGMAKIDEYLKQRSNEPPRGDIVDALLAFEFEGYDWMDKVGTMSQLTIGGTGTAGMVISGGMHHLATHPEDHAKLLEDRGLLPRAVDEFLRMFMGAPNMGRRAMKDVEVSGVKISAGDRVLLSYGAASRDPDVVEQPDEIDLTRRPTRHFAFGSGVHACIGQALGRLVITVAIDELLTRIPEFRLPDGFTPEYETANVRHMLSLPLIFDAAAVKAPTATAKEMS